MLHRGDASLARDRLDQTRLHFDFEIVDAADAAVLKPGLARLPGAWRRGTPAIVPKAPRTLLFSLSLIYRTNITSHLHFPTLPSFSPLRLPGIDRFQTCDDGLSS